MIPLCCRIGNPSLDGLHPHGHTHGGTPTRANTHMDTTIGTHIHGHTPHGIFGL